MNKTTNTLFIGKVLHEFDSLASTNQYASDLIAKESPPEGSAVITYDQYAGRGYTTNKWESEPGKNLTFSTILYPKFLAARKQFLLNQVVSLSVFDTLKPYIPAGLKIKWPNDIYIFNKKITGILIQNSLQGNNLQSAIIGIGLNVNQKIFKSDAPNPTSLALEIGKEMNLKSIFFDFCYNLETYYLQLKANQTERIQQDYLDNLFRFQESHHYKRMDGTIFKGAIRGITDIGKLMIETKDGVETFAFKEVGYLF